MHELSQMGQGVREIADITGLSKSEVSRVGQEIKGLTTDDEVQRTLGGYVKMELEDRFQAVHELFKNEHSVREIADITGLSVGTVFNTEQEIKGLTTDEEVLARAKEIRAEGAGCTARLRCNRD